MAYLIFEEEGRKKKLTLKRDFIFIGRGEGSHLRIKDPKASDRHCQILRVEDGWRVLDLGSEGGTFVNGERVEQKGLSEGDVIRVGDTEFTVHEVGAPAAAAAPEEAEARPVVVSHPGGAGRVARRRTGSRGGRREPLRIKKEFAEASERGGERLVRKKLRKGTGMPGWAQAVIAFWGVVIVILVALWVVKQSKPSPYSDQYAKAQDYIRQNQPFLAIKTLEQIPPEDPQWGKMARELHDRLAAEQEEGRASQDVKRAMEYYENNIMLYIHKYIDAPEKKPSWARKIQLEYAPDRKSYIRALILHRIDTYLKRFPDGADADKVKKLRRKYAKEVDLNKTPNYRDIEIEAECELNLNGFGPAWRLVDGYLKKYPDTQFKGRIQDMEDRIWHQLQIEWDTWKESAKQREAAGNPHMANKIYHRFLNLCEGYGDPRAKELLDFWKKRVEENDALIEKKAGLKLRTEGS